MQSLSNELRAEIFKLTKTPISLILTSSDWYFISQNPSVRSKWLIFKYGKAQALFHAIRLGNKFITVEVAQILIKNATISRYFVQRLFMQFGAYDEELIKLKIEHNANQVDSDRIHAFRKKLQSPWASNLSLQVFTKLIAEGFNKDNDLSAKGNDMELFHFLSAGPLAINLAPQKLFSNLGEIKDLILGKKFIPFPSRPKPVYEDTVEYVQLMQARAHEEYPPKDGYENSRQLNVIARAILIHPNLVNWWKEIDYYEICTEVNELVMQGALLTLFPPTTPANWEHPSVKDIVSRLKQLIDLGFELTDIVMEESFCLFEHRLNEIGDFLMDSFQIIRKESKSVIACSCLIRAIRPERNHKKTNLLEFYISKIDQPQDALKNALEHYNVGFNFDANSIKSVIKIRSLSVHSNFYYWVLKKFGIKSEITQRCFEDILESRIWIDLKLQETPELGVPGNLTKCAFNAICSIYLEFCNEKIQFKTDYLSYLQLANNDEIINPFFGISLPITFGMTLSYKLPFEISNYQYHRPDIQNNTKEFNETGLYYDQNEIEEWLKLFVLIKNSSDSTEIFRDKLEEFHKRIKPNDNEIY